MFAKYPTSVPSSSVKALCPFLLRIPALASTHLFLVFLSSCPHNSLSCYKNLVILLSLNYLKTFNALNCLIKSKLFSMIFKAFYWCLSLFPALPALTLCYCVTCVPTAEKFSQFPVYIVFLNIFMHMLVLL